MIPSLRRRKLAYQALFPATGGQMTGPARTVLADLARFCRASNPPLVKSLAGVADPLQTGVMIGRQEVFNRIRAMVLIDDRRLFNLEEDEE